MASTTGRRVVLPLTNKSGGGVIAGDVVIIDTGNDDAFTTTTSAAYTGTVGVAQETIASNATGPVLISGEAALVNVSASVTRGHYGATHTVAKQAAGQAARGAGTFCQFKTGGTTPKAFLYPVDLLGSSLTNPMSAIGDIIQGTTAGAPARLAAPLAGKVLTGAGVTTPVAYAYPPGYEFDYAQITAGVNVTATTEATADTIVTAGAVTYDGSTIIMVEFFAPYIDLGTASNQLAFLLYDNGTSIGYFGRGDLAAANAGGSGVAPRLTRRITPSAAAHTYSVRAIVTVTTGTPGVGAGPGTNGNWAPAFIRQTKV